MGRRRRQNGNNHRTSSSSMSSNIFDEDTTRNNNTSEEEAFHQEEEYATEKIQRFLVCCQTRRAALFVIRNTDDTLPINFLQTSVPRQSWSLIGRLMEKKTEEKERKSFISNFVADVMERVLLNC